MEEFSNYSIKDDVPPLNMRNGELMTLMSKLKPGQVLEIPAAAVKYKNKQSFSALAYKNAKTLNIRIRISIGKDAYKVWRIL